jgi:broad specificity phosphatase PhoE
MKILLVRHGESQANVNQSLHKIVPDHEIALSSLGKEQAERAGEIIKAYYERTFGELLEDKKEESQVFNHENIANVLQQMLSHMATQSKPKIRLWQSPYRRTRETAAVIEKALGNIILDKREHVLLCEQQFGLFDGVSREVQKEKFPEEYECFQHTRTHNGKFWARYPMGESAFDSACRIHQAFGTFKRDADDHGIENIVVVCHGTVLRLFTMMWRHLTPEWFAAEESPGNCAIRILDGKDDRGYIYGGHRDGKAWQYKGNKYG